MVSTKRGGEQTLTNINVFMGMKLINELSLIIEDSSPIFYDWNTKSIDDSIYDYIRKSEGDVNGDHIPYVYDDAATWVYNEEKEMRLPPKYKSGGKIKGTLTIGFGTTNKDIIKKYMGTTIDVGTANELSKNDILENVKAIQRWQGRAKPTDHNNRKLTKGMFIAMVDIAYNMGYPTFINEPQITNIEKGKFKTAQDWIRNTLVWGHLERKVKTANLFCKDGGCIDN